MNGKYSRVISFEPDTINYENCKKIVENKKWNDVEVINKGLWDKATTLSFYNGLPSDSRIIEGETENYKDASIVRQKKYLATIQDLVDGKVDCVVMDELPAREILTQKSGLMILDESLVEDSYGIIVKKGNDDLLEVVNRVIKRMQKDGSLKDSILRHAGE